MRCAYRAAAPGALACILHGRLGLPLTQCRATRLRRFEEHIDFASLQCNLYASGARNWWQQTHTLVKLQARLVD